MRSSAVDPKIRSAIKISLVNSEKTHWITVRINSAIAIAIETFCVRVFFIYVYLFVKE